MPNGMELTKKLSVHYSTVFQHLAAASKVKKPDQWVPCAKKLYKLRYEILPHPAYLLDQVLMDYFFEHLNHFLADRIFGNDTAVYQVVEPTFYQ